jgi:hypothetical protein
MKFPSFAQFIKSLVVGVLLAVIGYFLLPLLGLADSASLQALVLTLAFGAFLGGVLSAIEFGAGAATVPSESGEKQTVFVGNLAFKATQEELQQLFSPFGPVHSVRIMKDRATRRPRGFAFIEMDANHAPNAIKALDGKEFLGRTLRVNEGAERQERNKAA